VEEIIDFAGDMIEEMVRSRRRWVRWLGIGCIVMVVMGCTLAFLGVFALANH